MVLKRFSKRTLFALWIFFVALVAVVATYAYMLNRKSPNIRYFEEGEQISLELEEYVRIVDLGKSEILTIEGFIVGRAPGYLPYMKFWGYDEEGKIRKKYVNLFDVSGIDSAVARVTGKIDEVYSYGGDVSVTEIETIKTVEQVEESIKIVDEHWSNFSLELMERYSAERKDGGYSYPMWCEETQELIVYRNVGNMVKQPFFGDYGYVSTASILYFTTDKTITKILVFPSPH